MANLNYTPEIQPIKKVDKRNSADEAYSKVYRESFISKAKEEAETKRLADRANTLRWIVYSPIETKMGAIADTVKQNKINMLKSIPPEIRSELKQQNDSKLIQSWVIPREAQETKKLWFWDKAEEMNPARVIPWVWHAIRAKETADLAFAASRLYDDKATEKDLLLLDNFITKSEADKSFVYNVLSVLEEAPLLASEIMLTRWVATAWKKAAKEWAEAILKKVLTTQWKRKLAEAMAKKWLKRSFIKTSERIATWLAWEVLRAPIAWALRIPTSAMEKQAIDKIKKTWTDQELESILKSATKAYWETLVEYISERSGWVIWEWANAIWKYIWVPAVKSHIIKWWLFRAIAKANPTSRLDDIWKFVNKVWFNWVLNEVLEERVADIWQWALFSAWLWDQKFQLPTKEQLLTEFVSFWALWLWYATAWKVMDIMEWKTVDPSPELELVFRKDPVEMAKGNLTSPSTQQALDQVAMTRDMAESANIVNRAPAPVNPVKTNVKKLLQKTGKLSSESVSIPKTTKTTRTTKKPLTEAPVAPKKAPRTIKEVVEQPKANITQEPLEQEALKEALKYESVEDYVKAQTEKSYRSTHQIISKNTSPITKIDKQTLESFKDEFKRQYGYPALKSKEVNKLESIINNPEKEVTIYRASPKKELNSGDWVTIDKDYANDIKRQNGGNVYSYTVKAEELFYPKTLDEFKELPSLNKWGVFQYQDIKTKSKLIDIWNKAQKLKSEVKVEPIEPTEQPKQPTTAQIKDVSKKEQKDKDPLIQEAKKFESADEYIKAQGTPLYHGTSLANAENINKKGFSLTEQGYSGKPRGASNKGESLSFSKKRSVAELHAIGSSKDKRGGTVLEVFIDKNAKIFSTEDIPKEWQGEFLTRTELDTYARTHGFDGIDLAKLEDDGIIRGGKIGVREYEVDIWNVDKIKTRSQLIDIWKEAQKLKSEVKELDEIDLKFEAEKATGRTPSQIFADKSKAAQEKFKTKTNVSNILKEVNKKRASEARVRKIKETKEKKAKEKEVEEVKKELTNIAESVDNEKVTKEQLRAKLQEVQRRNLENKTWVRIEEPSKSDIKKIEKEERIMEEKPKATKTPARIRLEYKEVIDIIEKESASEVDRMIAEEKRKELSSQYYELTWNFIEDEIWGKNDFIWESDDMEEWSVELLLEWFNEEDFTWDLSERLYRKWTKDLNKNEVEEFIWNNIENEKKLDSIKERAERINSWKEKFSLSNIVFSIANKYNIIVKDQVWKSPYWKPKVIALSDRTNLVSFTHEVAHEMFYRDIYKNLWKEQYDFSWPLYNEMVALVWKKMTKEEITSFWNRISSNNEKIKKAAYTDFMSEAYSYMAEIVVKNMTEAKQTYPNMFNEFYVNKNSVFYNPKTIEVIKEINYNLKLYRELSKPKMIEAQITTETNRKEAKNVWLLNHKKRLVNNVRYSWTAVREFDKAYAKARWLKVKNKDIFINNWEWSLEKIYQSFRPTSERAISNIMWGNWLWKLDPKKWTLEKYSDVNYSEMVESVERRWLTWELGSFIIARLNRYDYENYKKLLPAEIKAIEKDIKFHEDRIEMIENSDQDKMIKDEDIEEEMNSIKELKEEKKQLEELKNRIRTNLLSMPWVKVKTITNRKWKKVNVVDMTDVEETYNKLKDKYKQELEVFDTVNKFNLELAYESWEISEREYKIYSSKKWYSPAFREVVQTSSWIANKKVKTNLISFKRREWGEWAVYNPLTVIPYLHIQAMQAYNKNIFLSELYKAWEYLPDIISRWESAWALEAKIDWKRNQFTILDADLMKSVDSEYNREFNDSWARKKLSEASRLFVSMTTGKNPWFALKNIFIDIPTSFIFSETWYIPWVSQATMVARAASSNEEIEMFKKYWTEYNSLWWYKSHWSNVNFDKVNPQDIINLMSKKWKAYQKAKEKIWNVLWALPAFTETLTRFTEYYRSRRLKWLDVMESFENARNVSGSFHKKWASSAMRNAVSVIPYLNSGTQIMFESIKQMTSKKWATRMAQIALVYTLIQVAQALRMRRDYEEAITDEEKEEAMLRINKYLDRTAFQKTNFIYTKSWKFKIPSNPLFSWLWAMLSVKILAEINPYYEANYKEMMSEMPSWLAWHRVMETSVSAIANSLALPFNILFNRWEWGEELVESFKNLAWAMAWLSPVTNTAFALAWFKTYPSFEAMDPYWDKKDYYADDSKMAILISRGTWIPARNISWAVRAALGTLWLNIFDLVWEIVMKDETAEDLMLTEPKPLGRLLRDQTKSFRWEDLFIARSWEFTNKLFEERNKIEKEIADLNNRKNILKWRVERWIITKEDWEEYIDLLGKLEDKKGDQSRINRALKVRKFIVDVQDWKYYKLDIPDLYSSEDLNDLYYIFRKISEWKNLDDKELDKITEIDISISEFLKDE